MKNNPDLKQMSGKQLFEHYTGKKSQYSIIVQMLVYSTQDIEKAYEILERCERENKKPFPFYPGIGRDTRISEDELNSFEYVGDIIDGEMYLVPSDWLIKNNLINTLEL
jgi:hypothetical protein